MVDLFHKITKYKSGIFSIKHEILDMEIIIKDILLVSLINFVTKSTDIIPLFKYLDTQ